MKKIILYFLFCSSLFTTQSSLHADELKITTNNSKYKKAYFAGGCFWCMEEAFDKTDGVVKSISGYSGGHLKNPKYEDVIYRDTGHVEAIEITYDPKKTSYENLLRLFWKNIDPFDKYGQFCDKGKSYRSVVFFQNENQKKTITDSIQIIEKKLYILDCFY